MATGKSYKRFMIKVVRCEIEDGQTENTTATKAADAELVGGQIIGWYPDTNADQLVDSIVLTATTGAITVTLAAAATAHNYINVVVMVRK